MLDQHTVLYTHSDQFSPRYAVVVLRYQAPTVPNLVLVFPRLVTAREILQVPFVAGVLCLTSDVIFRHAYLSTPSKTA
jgi:hypothetical protein